MRPHADTTLDELDRFHNGPPPQGAVSAALLGGVERRSALSHAALLSLHTRLSAEARLGTARRRITLTADGALRDRWLHRLAATLAHHRHAASALRAFLPHV